MASDRKRSGGRAGGEERQVVGESSGSEPLVKKSKSSISSSMSKSNDANKSNEASNKTLAKITIEHCNS